MFDDTDIRHAKLKIRLQHDSLTQAEFFRAMVTGYIEKDATIVKYIDQYKETNQKQSKLSRRKVKKDIEIESLKIAVREITDQDISSRNLNKKTTGVVITDISSRSPLSNLLSVNDIIIEVQKTSVKNSSDLKRKVEGFFKKGEKTLLLTIINKDNRRRYLGVKIN